MDVLQGEVALIEDGGDVVARWRLRGVSKGAGNGHHLITDPPGWLSIEVRSRNPHDITICSYIDMMKLQRRRPVRSQEQ